MKKLFYSMLVVLVAVCCTHDRTDEYPVEETSSFMPSDARAFFERHAADLRAVDFGIGERTRAASDDNVVPDWSAAEITRADSITTVEVPLGGDVMRFAQVISRSSTGKSYVYTTRVATKLIVQKHEASGVCRHFVATFVDDASLCRRKDVKHRYNGAGDYSGYVIISSVDGRYVDSYRSRRGVWSPVGMWAGGHEEATRCAAGDDSPEAVEETGQVRLRFLGTGPAAAAYNLGESDMTCSRCGNPLGLCTCCPACGGVGCEFCTIVVTPTSCPRCHNPLANCICCKVCRNYPCVCQAVCPICNRNPCQCGVYKCPYCGRTTCNGSCRDVEEPETCKHRRCSNCKKPIESSSPDCSVAYHEFCTCPIQVTVSASVSEVDVLVPYQITVSVTGPNLSPDYDIYLYMKRNTQHDTMAVSMGPYDKVKGYYERKSLNPGMWNIFAKVYYDTLYVSDPITVHEMFPEASKFRGRRTIKAELESMWNECVKFAEDNQDTHSVREYGCMVYLDAEGNYYCGDHVLGPVVELARQGVSGSVIVGEDNLDDVHDPKRTIPLAVGNMHTHYPLTWAAGECYRPVGPSEGDENSDMPGMLWDYITIRNRNLKAGHDVREQTMIYLYGPNRRATWFTTDINSMY